MHIPEHIVEEVRHRSDIVEVVGEHVRLQKRGKNFLGLCPFHTEKTPSFNVNPELGIYKCFGCGKSGSVINFVMDHNSLSFPEAVRMLARRAGIVIDDDQRSDAEKEEFSRSDAAHRALGSAVEFYETQLHKAEGKVALRYLNGRGFDEHIIHAFHCGYSPDDWQATSVELLRQGFTEQALEDAGLIIRRDDGGMYDRFRGRLMFPIHDAMGRVAGFGARVLQADSSAAKYVNSPQSKVYDKSRIVYGLYQAKNEIRKQDKALLTEGYADTISLHQFGFGNAVASSGTALTSEQLKLIARYSKNITIAYDGDDAGINATMRAIEIAVPLGFDVSVISLPNKEDPDTYVRNHGADAFARRLREAKHFLDYMAERFKELGRLSSPKGTAEAVRELVKLISGVDDVLQREFLLRSLASKFAMREEMLHAEMAHIKGTSQRVVGKTSRGSESLPRTEQSQASPLSRRAESGIGAEEKVLLLCALRSPEALRAMESEFGIDEELFISESGKKIFSALRHAIHNGLDQRSIVTESDALGDEERAFITDLLFNDRHPSERWMDFNVEVKQTDFRRVIADAVLRIHLRRVTAELQEVKEAIRASESEELLIRFTELNKQRQELENEMRQVSIHNPEEES
ncbi:MAG: DNA primase [Candidatus Kapaibacterium sp.]